jgi:hypothetical protein
MIFQMLRDKEVMSIKVATRRASSVVWQASSVPGFVYCSLHISAENICFGTTNYTLNNKVIHCYFAMCSSHQNSFGVLAYCMSFVELMSIHYHRDLLLTSSFKHIRYQSYCNITFLCQFLGYCQSRNWSMISQSHINPGHHIALAAKFCTVCLIFLGPQYGTSCHLSDA